MSKAGFLYSHLFFEKRIHYLQEIEHTRNAGSQDRLPGCPGGQPRPRTFGHASTSVFAGRRFTDA
jgi:hypothetical protein